MHQGTCRVGTSGWVYGHWRGSFYPADLPQSRWFQYYAGVFDTVEINNTFYRLPEQPAFDGWREQAPEGFLYAVKANRYLTHLRRLSNAAEPLERFLERSRRLGPRLGPILYQLPPRWLPNVPRLREFCQLLPGDLLHAMEFRDPRWFIPEVFEVLAEHNVAFCIFDMPNVECPLAVTAQSVYIRFHGASSTYAGSYPDESLRAWAGRIIAWQQEGHDVYVYFNNDAYAHAVRNALSLRDLVAGA